MRTIRTHATAGFAPAAIVTAFGLAATTNARATLINFDTLPSGTILSNQYPEVVFSSSPGNINIVIDHPSAISAPNILCSGPAVGPYNCIEDTYLNFTNPVNDLTFWAIEANVAGVTARFRVFQNGVFTTTVDFISTGGAGHNQFVDLSVYTGITRLEIVDILDNLGKEAGIGWDSFEFTVVPTPATIVLVAGVWPAILRRRRGQPR